MEPATTLTFNACLSQMLTQQIQNLAAARPNANILSQSPTELLPQIMLANPQEKPQIWMWRARDLLQDAMKQSRHGVPDYVARAVEAWSVGSTASLEQKNGMIHGIETYLEDTLSSSLREIRAAGASAVRSISPPPAAVVPMTVSANTNGAAFNFIGAPFDCPREGGIPLLESLISQLEVARTTQSKKTDSVEDLQVIRELTDRIPYPIATAALMGDEGLGPLLDSNLALNEHFGWKRLPLSSSDKLTGVRGMTIRGVLHPSNFAIARILLLRPGGAFKPSKMRFMKGEARNLESHKRTDDHYIPCMGAGRVTSYNGRILAFGIFTELADSVAAPRKPK